MNNSSYNLFDDCDDEILHKTSQATANLVIKLIDYIQHEFKTDRAKATFTAGVLIASLPEMIEENEGGREGVQEIINDFENIYSQQFNQN
ncbi:hypothetical protein Riv7116_1865 [Rivularia sp. PCC 7116]|uniref:hypothetical protein n=1 Tax=Rivularia sp. PCC 7116 TaxID=373994 RepID=UPI00029EF45C|nr:hypothetical protein [Rivularia sp. PCC 7116]AFY54406.1 hypothetical protein Riv7116_1865 [Rivularia sp. PCC 7116]